MSGLALIINCKYSYLRTGALIGVLSSNIPLTDLEIELIKELEPKITN